MSDTPVTRLTRIETGMTHRKDGSVEFYWVRPPFTLGLFVGSNSDPEMIEWCEQTFGPPMTASDSSGRWLYKGYRYFFVDQNDMAMFVLRVS